VREPGSEQQAVADLKQVLSAFHFILELTTPAAQIISHQNARAVCQDCGAEIINNRKVVVDGKVLCQMYAYGGY